MKTLDMIRSLRYQLLLPLIGLVISCSNDMPPTPSDAHRQSETHYISLNAALGNAEQMYGEIFGTTTRCGLKVADVQYLGSNTRSGEQMHGFYVVNYADNAGFAMLSADDRRARVYAISDEGCMNLTDTLHNAGLNWYLNRYACDNSIYGTLPIDKGGGGTPLDTTIAPWPMFNETYYYTYSKPMLKGFLAKFHQDYPYNGFCPVKNGQRCLTGCAPLAAGTIMGYFKHPASQDEIVFDWEYMTTNPYADGWAKLFAKLGSKDYMNANYNPEGTGVTPEVIKNVFPRCGYVGTYELKQPFATPGLPTISDELKNNRPVLMVGFNTIDGGHAWVIDGGFLRSVTGIDNIRETYCRCVWGWGGNANGYFLYDSRHLGGTPSQSYDHEAGAAPLFELTLLIGGFTPNS